MKKITIYFALAFTLFLVSCTETAPVETVEVESPAEVIEVVEVVEETPDNSTTVVVDGNGIQLESEKIDVKVTKE